MFLTNPVCEIEYGNTRIEGTATADEKPGTQATSSNANEGYCILWMIEGCVAKMTKAF